MQIPLAAAPGRRRWLKPLVLALALVPLAKLVVALFLGRLGANPIAESLNRLGFWALMMLLASLSCTPLQIVLGWNWALKVRKLLGLLAFFYAVLHVSVYLGVDQFFDWGEIFKDIVKRKFITVGLAAFLMLIPLAATSTKGMVKRMGFVRWKRLHRLAYLAAAAAVIHFIWRVKSDLREPLLYAGIFLLLMAVRAFQGGRQRKASAAL